MENLTFNPKDWPQGSRAIVVMPSGVEPTEVQVLEWSPSGGYVRLQIFEGLNEPRIWRTPETDWQLIEKLGGVFGR